MTLDTRIYVLGEVDVHELFREGQRLLHLADERVGLDCRTPEQQRWRDEPQSEYHEGGRTPDRAGRRSIFNEIGQGLPAILDITYREGGPLKATDEECERYCSSPCDRDEPHSPAHWCVISLDTTYSYRSSLGGCSDLHVVLMKGFADWLGARDVTFSWMNEYTGKVHAWPMGVQEFGRNGAAAAEWFFGTVRPALDAMGIDAEQ